MRLKFIKKKIFVKTSLTTSDGKSEKKIENNFSSSLTGTKSGGFLNASGNYLVATEVPIKSFPLN